MISMEAGAEDSGGYGTGPFGPAGGFGEYEYIEYADRYDREPRALRDLRGNLILHMPLDGDAEWPMAFVGEQRLLVCSLRRIVGIRPGWEFLGKVRGLARERGFLHIFTGESMAGGVKYKDLSVAGVRFVDELHTWLPMKIAEQLKAIA